MDNFCPCFLYDLEYSVITKESKRERFIKEKIR